MKIITQEIAMKNLCQLEAKLFDGNDIESHPKYAQIIACYRRMRDAAIAPRFNAITFEAAQSNLSTFLNQSK